MDPVEELFEAVAKGDVERVRKLLKSSVEVNAKNRRGIRFCILPLFMVVLKSPSFLSRMVQV
jgi:hypothetical protein